MPDLPSAEEFHAEAVRRAMERAMLELAVNGDTTPNQRDQDLIRAAIGIGTTEAMQLLDEILN